MNFTGYIDESDTHGHAPDIGDFGRVSQFGCETRFFRSETSHFVSGLRRRLRRWEPSLRPNIAVNCTRCGRLCHCHRLHRDRRKAVDCAQLHRSRRGNADAWTGLDCRLRGFLALSDREAERLLAQDASPTAIAEAVGVSRQVVYRVQDDPAKAEAGSVADGTS
jgi:hypothetical protein